MTQVTAPLGEVANVFNGKTPARSDQREVGHPVLKIKDIGEDGVFSGMFDSFVEAEFATKHKNKYIEEGDVLILNAAHNSEYVGSKQCKASSAMCGALATGEWLVARSKCQKLLQSYLWYWFQTPYTRFLIKKRVKGIHLYPRDIAQLQIPLPDLAEQHRIAAILDRADGIRRKRESALALADAFLRSWFLEVFGNPRRIDSTGIVLADIASIARGRFSPRPRNDPRFYGGNFPFIQTGEISNADGYLTDYRQTLNEDGTRVSKSFPKGTVFVAIVGATIGATAISSRKFWCPDSVIGINSECEDYPPEFIEYLLRFWRPVFVARAPETARANINLETLRPVPIPRASNGEAKIFGQLYKKIHSIKCRLKEADNPLFNSLTQRAFRGKL